jgi:cell division protein FtsQ
VIASSASVQIQGNSHMTRPQLLSVFGEDVDRNILTVPLSVRRAELEQLPWVEHATVMRLLPNKLRVAVKERTPVAFVRQSGRIGLVDANGVLLDMSPDAPKAEVYSFPVVTGISAGDPLSVRAARIKVYLRFMADMDSASKDLSEVDLSDPEDVKALVPSAGSDILVHFGEDDFLRRYQVYSQHVAEWKTTNPRLASVDMRYEHQVVLEMAKPVAGEASEAEDDAEPTSQKRDVGHPAVAVEAPKMRKTLAKAVAKRAAKPGAARVTGHLQTAFDVPAKTAAPAAKGVPK